MRRMRVPQWVLVTICLSGITFQAPSCLAQSLSTVNQKANKKADEIHEYRDPKMGISFKMGHDWKIEQATHWLDPGWREWSQGWNSCETGGLATRRRERSPEVSDSLSKLDNLACGQAERRGRPIGGRPAVTILVRQHGTHESLGLYYRVGDRRRVKRVEIQSLLLADADDKISQRREKDGFGDYHIRRGSYEQGEIDGWPSLTWVAYYTSGKHDMAEYLVWVRSETTLAQFFIRCPADQLDQVRERVKPIIRSLRIR